ncbi:MAG: NAD(P)-dependent oxidoreductase [Halioglobus sp.]
MVTGANGLVGKAVCDAFFRLGVSYLPLVRSRSQGDSNQIAVDLSSDIDLLEIVKQPVSCVVHTAAAVPLATHYPDTEDLAYRTRRIDDTVMRALESWRCPIVYMSSCGLYDKSQSVVKREVAPISVSSPYFFAKFEGEKVFEQFKDATILRLSAPIGLGQRQGSIVSRFITSVRDGKDIELWGTGRREQNFIDVDDIATLVCLIVSKPVKAILNVASPNPVTMEFLANLIVDVVGRGRVVYSGIDDPHDGETARYDVNRVKSLYRWAGKTSLEETVRKLVAEDFRE